MKLSGFEVWFVVVVLAMVRRLSCYELNITNLLIFDFFLPIGSAKFCFSQNLLIFVACQHWPNVYKVLPGYSPHSCWICWNQPCFNPDVNDLYVYYL